MSIDNAIDDAERERRRNRLKMVLVVRNDLNMRKGKVGAQTGHAVQELLIDRSGAKPVLREDDFVMQWLSESYPKVVLKIDNEAALLAVYEQAIARGLSSHLVQDRGDTEFHGVPTYTVVSIGPAPAHLIDEITGSLKPL